MEECEYKNVCSFHLIFFRDVHTEKLDTLCRTCGNKIKNLKGKYKFPKLVAEYHLIIKQLFEYDISNDKENVHPKKICESCLQKFKRCSDSKTGFKTDDTLPIFLPHSDTACTICKPSTVRKKPFKLYSETLTKVTYSEIKGVDPIDFNELKNISSSFGFLNITREVSSLHTNKSESQYCFVKVIFLKDCPVNKFSVTVSQSGEW